MEGIPGNTLCRFAVGFKGWGMRFQGPVGSESTVCLRCALHPVPPAWLLGFPHRPPESSCSLSCTARRSASWTRPDSFSQLHLPGATVPLSARGGREAGPSGGWPEGEGRDQGLRQVTHPTQRGRSLSLPRPLPALPAPPPFPAPSPLTRPSGRSKGWLVRGGGVSPGVSSAAGESKHLRWPDVRASVGGPE